MDCKIAMLYEKDNPQTIANFKELMIVSENQNILYNYFSDFLKMITDKRYLVRLKGFRLLCKQTKWDTDNKIDTFTDEIVSVIQDEKPTATRQKIQSLKDILPYKKDLHGKIKNHLLSINVSMYENENMQDLIKSDIKSIMDMM